MTEVMMKEPLTGSITAHHVAFPEPSRIVLFELVAYARAGKTSWIVEIVEALFVSWPSPTVRRTVKVPPAA